MLVIDCPGYSTTAGRYIESRGFRATVISTTLGQEKRRAANEIRTRVERTYQSSFSNGPLNRSWLGRFETIVQQMHDERVLLSCWRNDVNFTERHVWKTFIILQDYQGEIWFLGTKTKE